MNGSMVTCAWALTTTKSRDNIVGATRPVLVRRFWLTLYGWAGLGRRQTHKPAGTQCTFCATSAMSPDVRYSVASCVCTFRAFPGMGGDVLHLQKRDRPSGDLRRACHEHRLNRRHATLCASILQRRNCLNATGGRKRGYSTTLRSQVSFHLGPTRRRAKVGRMRLDSSGTDLTPSRTLASPR